MELGIIEARRTKLELNDIRRVPKIQKLGIPLRESLREGRVNVFGETLLRLISRYNYTARLLAGLQSPTNKES